MVSIKHIINCLGTESDNISIIKDFYGLQALPQTMRYTGISLLRQVQLLQGKHFHINIVQIGLDWEKDEVKRKLNKRSIAVSIQDARNTFSQVNIGIGRVRYFVIGPDKSNGHEIIESRAEAKDLTREWYVLNDGIDVFFVLSWFGGHRELGASVINGPCEMTDKKNRGKDDACSMTAAVVSLSNEDPIDWLRFTGQVLAHELGHYLGLRHALDYSRLDSCMMDDYSKEDACVDDQELEYGRRLMFPSRYGNNNILSAEEGNIMKGHCTIKAGCL